MSDQIGEMLARAKQNDTRALARLLSLLESSGPAALARYPELSSPQKLSFRVGLTGPPGAGKSTLIGGLISELRKAGLRVAVIAVDPSSPFTQGAVLGDRIRYSHHFGDSGVFIRSLGSRGSAGGLSASTYLMARAFDCTGFDVTLIETVGVGQTELDVMHVADWVGVVLVPESGDSVQGMKAGLLEIADLFIVNKSDRPGAEAFRNELEAALGLDSREGSLSPHVTLASALSGAGVEALAGTIASAMGSGDWQMARREPHRLQAEAKALLRSQYESQIETLASIATTPETLAELFKSKN